MGCYYLPQILLGDKSLVGNKVKKKDLKVPFDIILTSFMLVLQSHKMVKHTQTIHRQIADELLECVWPFCGVGA